MNDTTHPHPPHPPHPPAPASVSSTGEWVVAMEPLGLTVEGLGRGPNRVVASLLTSGDQLARPILLTWEPPAMAEYPTPILSSQDQMGGCQQDEPQGRCLVPKARCYPSGGSAGPSGPQQPNSGHSIQVETTASDTAHRFPGGLSRGHEDREPRVWQEQLRKETELLWDSSVPGSAASRTDSVHQ